MLGKVEVLTVQMAIHLILEIGIIVQVRISAVEILAWVVVLASLSILA